MLIKPSSCIGCVLEHTGTGFMEMSGTGSNGVMLVGEALGADEAAQGKPFVGKAGFTLDKLLQRGGLNREEFKIANVVWCQPPANKLSGMWYQEQAIQYCSPNLDNAIEQMKPKAIVTLGVTAFQRVLPEIAAQHGIGLLDAKKKKGVVGYTFWSQRYNCWVTPTVHPSFILRGQTAWAQSLIFCLQRAVENSLNGYSYEAGDYTLDCTPADAHRWIDEFESYYGNHPDCFLSCDIETPEKDADEAELDLESYSDYVILRCGYSYRDGHGLSIPWDGPYRLVHERLLKHTVSKCWWNGCPTPDHKVLTADLKWKAAGDIELGEALVSFDENPVGRRLRRYKTGIVISNNRYLRKVYKVSLSDGDSIKVTGEHPWLCKPSTGTKRRSIQWTRTEDLKRGDIIPKLFDTWEQSNAWELGYLAGFYDGEGSLAFEKTTNTVGLSVAQKIGPTLDRVLQYLRFYGFDPHVYPKHRDKEPDARSVNLGGNNREQARFLGLVRPERLMAKFSPELLGAVWGYEKNERHIINIEDIGEQEIVTLSLDTGTYILEGYGAHNSYDQPRIISQNIMIGGTSHDGMDAWHILNSDLKKSLNFVTPWFRKRLKMWKHLSNAQPAFYNAVDADAAGSNLRGTIALLKKHGLYKIYEEFVLELDPVYAAMTRAGMPIDSKMRLESAHMLTVKRKEVLEKLNSLVPDSIKPLTPKEGYKKVPKDTTGLTEIIFNGVLNKYCSACNVGNPGKSHFKSKQARICDNCGGKWSATHCKARKKSTNPCEGAAFHSEESNPCAGAHTVEKLEGEKRWAKMGRFVPSTKGILNYQKVKKHPLIMVGKGEDRKATTDEKALKKLIGRHPEDLIYPGTLEYRELQTISSRYIGGIEEGKLVGGFPVGRDGRVHGIFRHSPSTLRSSMVSPNLQNIPRGDDSDVQKLVKQIFVASPGHTFVARDFSGIEAVLVGYEAGDKDYIRLAKIDVHSYFTAYNLNRLGIIPATDLPQLSWSDDDLAGALGGIKKRFKYERQGGKKVIHSANYRIGPKHMSEDTPQWFPRPKDAAMVLAFYYDLFPLIDKWHERLCLQVDKSAVIQNAFGHTHRFYQVLQWEKQGSDWTWSYGDDAKRLIAFGPQSNAALIGKRAMKKCYYNYPDSMARWLRLFIHDEMFTEPPIDRADEADAILQYEMEQPIPEMRLNPEWGMGDFLTIGSEGKRGNTWAIMK